MSQEQSLQEQISELSGWMQRCDEKLELLTEKLDNVLCQLKERPFQASADPTTFSLDQPNDDPNSTKASENDDQAQSFLESLVEESDGENETEIENPHDEDSENEQDVLAAELMSDDQPAPDADTLSSDVEVEATTDSDNEINEDEVGSILASLMIDDEHETDEDQDSDSPSNGNAPTNLDVDDDDDVEDSDDLLGVSSLLSSLLDDDEQDDGNQEITSKDEDADNDGEPSNLAASILQELQKDLASSDLDSALAETDSAWPETDSAWPETDSAIDSADRFLRSEALV